MSLPSVETVRKRIEKIRKPQYRMACMAAYLLAARICEICGESYWYEKHYGITGKDVYLGTYVLGNRKYDAAVFKVHTAKRGGLVRNVALPLDFEPWAEQLYQYIMQFGEDYAFPFKRQQVWYRVKEVFRGLTYPIDSYIVTRKGEVKKVKAHKRKFALHALRHLRSTELVETYGFDGFNLAAYCGWTISTSHAMFGVRVPKVVARYLYLNWQGYFPKLLKPRR